MNAGKNRIAVITGFYNGIGKQTALELAREGMTIIGIGRSDNKANAAIEEISNDTKNAQLDYVHCDLAEIDQVKNAAKRIASKYKKIDVLINNAGIINSSLVLNSQGLENTFAVSAMASFLLARLLLEKLLQSDSPGIINLISEAYKQGEVDFKSFTGKGKYKIMRSYSNAKFAESLWTYDMAERLTDTNIFFRLVHPGLVPNTGGLKRMPPWIRPIMKIIRYTPIANTLEQGAKPAVESALQTDTKQKILYLKEGIPTQPVKKVFDKQKQTALWNFLCEQSGLPINHN